MAEASIYIHAAPLAVYRAFCDVAQWPSWYPNVIDAEWIAGEPWQDEAKLRIRVRTLIGQTSGTAIVRMAQPGQRLVYENVMMGLQVVCTVTLGDDIGGSRLSIRKHYHGPLAFLMRMFGPRQHQMLTHGLTNLKKRIEGAPRR